MGYRVERLRQHVEDQGFKVGSKVFCIGKNNSLNDNKKLQDMIFRRGKIIAMYDHFMVVDLGVWREGFRYYEVIEGQVRLKKRPTSGNSKRG